MRVRIYKHLIGIAAAVTVICVAFASPASAARSTQVVSKSQKSQPSNARAIYVVKEGDNLWDIATATGVSVDRLTAINNFKNPDRVLPGDKVLLRGGVAIPKHVTSQRTQSDVAKANAQFGATVFSGNAISSTTNSKQATPPELAQRASLRASFRNAARDYKVSVNLLQAMAWNESGWQNHVVSSTGAVGIGQLMPDTVAFVNESLVSSRLNPGNPEHNIQMSAAYLHYLLSETNGNVPLALAAYYQGLHSVRTNGVFAETRHYVDTVLAVQRAYFS